ATPTGVLLAALRGPRSSGAAPPRAPTVAAQDTLPRVRPPLVAGGHAADAALIGRDAEVARLREIIDDSFGRRRCRAVLLRGEPGIGKSRLLDAAAALAREAGAAVLEAAAYEAESIRPFALFVDALRRHEPTAAAAVFAPADA